MPTIDEPDSPAAIATWISDTMRSHDRFAGVYAVSEQHRVAHGVPCTVYPTGSGPLLATLTAAIRPRRLLEVGTGLGYSALCLASGAPPDAVLDTIEQDTGHAELAREQIANAGYGATINVLAGSASGVLVRLQSRYDLIFWDGDPDQCLVALEAFLRLLAPGGTLITSNLFLGQYDASIPGLEQSAEYRRRIVEEPRLRTAFLPSGMAVSVRRQ